MKGRRNCRASINPPRPTFDLVQYWGSSHRWRLLPPAQGRKPPRLPGRGASGPGGHPFFTQTEEPDITHGRFDERRIEVYPFEPLEANLPAARSLAVIHRTHTGEAGEVPQVAYYITTEPMQEGCARRFGELARRHWAGCEIRNHWVRDHCMREGATRSKNYNLR